MAQSHLVNSNQSISRSFVFSRNLLSPRWNIADRTVEVFQQQAVTKKRHLTSYRKCPLPTSSLTVLSIILVAFDPVVNADFSERGLLVVSRTCSPNVPDTGRFPDSLQQVWSSGPLCKYRWHSPINQCQHPRACCPKLGTWLQVNFYMEFQLLILILQLQLFWDLVVWGLEKQQSCF